jgi:hypothetical protein
MCSPPSHPYRVTETVGTGTGAGIDKNPAANPVPAAAPAAADEDEDEEEVTGKPVEKSNCGDGSGGTEKSLSMNSMRMTSRAAL